MLENDRLLLNSLEEIDGLKQPLSHSADKHDMHVVNLRKELETERKEAESILLGQQEEEVKRWESRYAAAEERVELAEKRAHNLMVYVEKWFNRFGPILSK